MNGQIPFGGGTSQPGVQPGPNRPGQSNVVIVEPEVTFPGTMVYAKAGNIWVQSGKDVRQLTDSGVDAMPASGRMVNGSTCASRLARACFR